MDGFGFHCLTFGCQMNVNDSQWVARALAARGFIERPLERADVIFLNTCSVREKPEQKVYSALGRIRRLNPRAVVGVAGCVAQQLGEELMQRSPQVRLVAGSDGVASVPDAFVRLLQEPELRLSFLAFTETFPDRDPCLAPDASGGVTPVAYVNIMQGCDNFCAYCIVPYTRGPRKSRSTQAVLDECRAWVRRGAGDITLLGQNVNVFGMDAGGDGTSFPQLLRQVAAIPGLRRLRFVSAHPRDLSQETIDLFAELPQLCPRLHLPLQSGSDSMLQKMGRGYTMERYLQVVEALRRARPDFALSTDLIVGFPSETEAEFEDTLKAVDTCGFMSSFSFCYSDRPGTRASAMPFKIPREVQLERLERLQNLQNDRAEAWLRSRAGRTTDVLLEALSPKQDGGEPLWQGRDPWGDPVNVRMPEGRGRPGLFVNVTLDAAKKHSLMASLREE
ncbi:tRNA (N6-isopentenyl adenosine(37)-C2)-methylthiotransferase MiaB [uncultured Mailhella sp.]|uniref:tRNA (N6-isopentenyl adenosine(37)-C2)-methylthiotransferase MiaB n=1 Tax=uncultured Mailhella sp. TaxID=1981031 RepID=UPI002636153C|nr:tRNA (N6-isopentenyl adenosine(37)-C2)-methylthiotransferase MiaB [uncultured Mailhella sp.]